VFPSTAPAVSVIMPAYNAAPYIDGAVASVLTQTFADLELIVVDDGSIDETPQRLAALAARDSRVRVIHQPNRGVSAARNAALELSRGRFLALLDSDDEWAPQFLTAQIAALSGLPRTGVATANALERGGRRDGFPLRRPTTMLRHLRLRDLIEDETAVCVMAVFRREVCEAIGGFDERLHCGEDYHFWLRAARAGFGIVQTPEPLGWYRRRPDGASANESAMLDGVRVVLAELRESCADDAELVDLIDAQLRRFERERLVLAGKQALVDGAYPLAAQAFAQASRLDGGPKLRAVAVACRVAPRSLRAVYFRMRSAGVLPGSG
jgi:GT2 family glycosyltransferase